MINKFINAIKEQCIDGYLVFTESNIRYLLKEDMPPGFLLVLGDEVYFSTKSRNIDYYKKQNKQINFLFGDIKILMKYLKNKKIGFESNSMNYYQYDNIRKESEDIDFVPLPFLIENFRLIKSDEEIEYLKKAAEIGDRTFSRILEDIKPGLTEKQIKDKLSYYLLDEGGEDFSFTPLVSSGKRCFIPHSKSTKKIVNKGDFLLMDFGVVLNGYCSDMTRTIILGKANQRQIDMYNLVLKAQKYAIENIKAGITAHEADNFARSIIMSNTPVGCYDYGLGHGVGLEVHEKTRLKPNSDIILQKNQVVTVEPGIYIEGWGGIRIEDMIIVKDIKSEVITKSTKDLIEL